VVPITFRHRSVLSSKDACIAIQLLGTWIKASDRDAIPSIVSQVTNSSMSESHSGLYYIVIINTCPDSFDSHSFICPENKLFVMNEKKKRAN